MLLVFPGYMNYYKIANHNDLRYFIHQDCLMNDFNRDSLFLRIKQILFPNPIIDYLYSLRKAEYYTNVKTFFSEILRFYWRRKLLYQGIKLGFSIPPNTCGPGLSLPHYGNIVINPQSRIGHNCRIHSGVNIGASAGSKSAPQIGDNVYIAPGAILYGDIRIGSNNSIGANATVNKSFEEEHVVIAGTPAKILKVDSKNWLEFNHKN